MKTPDPSEEKPSAPTSAFYTDNPRPLRTLAALMMCAWWHAWIGMFRTFVGDDE